MSITIHDLILLTSERLEPSLLYVLGQKVGNKARRSRLYEFEMLCSFIDTGTNAVLRTDECNIDQSSVQDTKTSVKTAGGHVLKAKGH